MEFHFAPVQGNTDAAFRHFHSFNYPGDLTYYTPFIRLEKGTIRNRDLKDVKSELNSNQHLIPQIIFRNEDELLQLIQILRNEGVKEIDLNMGCPFPLQTGHGRGAGAISNNSLAEKLADVIADNKDISFSLKMRLGLNDPTEWKNLLPFLNQIKLRHITLHPRIAKQQYSGVVDLEQFSKFLNESKNPVIYNGDIKSPEDIDILLSKFPDIKGIMIGRGALARPSIFKEYLSKAEIPQEQRINKMLDFHNQLFNYYSEVLCGDSQVIGKIKTFWEYSEEEIGRKAWKAIKKASNIAKYQTAVALIQNSL